MTVVEGVVAPPATRIEPRPALAPPDAGRPRRRAVADPVVWTTALVALVGLALHLYLLFHASVSGDEATVGQMAQQVLRGHVSAFFWGQQYGGVEPYGVAVAFAVFGQSAFTLKAVPVALSALACLLTYRVAVRATRRRRVGAAVAALVWVWPEVALWNSTRESGFRMVTMCCGLGCVLLACRVADASKRDDVRRVVIAAAELGLAAGIGWWASPEVAYFLVPAVVIVGGVALRRRPPDRPGRRLAVIAALATAVPAAMVGALPWIWDAATNGLAGLRFAPLGPPTTYAARLSIFGREVAPMLLGLRREGTGAWVLPTGLAVALFVALAAAAVAAIAAAARRPGLPRALAVGLVAFPFLYAIPARAAFWNDGRFAVYVVPMLGIALGALAVAVVRAGEIRATERALARGFAHPAGRALAPDPALVGPVSRPPGLAARAAAAVALAALTSLTVVAFGEVYRGALSHPTSFFTGWRNPDDPVIAATTALRAHGVRVVYADYWVASVVAYVGHDRPEVVSFDTVRNVERNRQALAAGGDGRVAWLFDDPRAQRQAAAEFTAATVGPDNVSLARFEAFLRSRGTPFTTIELRPLVAVIPAGAVTPADLGIPATAYLRASG